MSAYKATHIPYGLTDASKRTIRNPGIKDEVEFKQYGIETSGEYTHVSCLVNGEGGVPIHRHFTYGETMQAVQGSIGVVGHNGTKTMILSPESGESYTVKPGEWHRFFNPSPTEACIFEAKVRPAHQGFEILLHILYGLVDDGHGTPEGLPSSIFYLLMLNDMGDMGFPGFGGWLMGLVSKAARLLAWVTGEEERLIRKYYGRPITDEEKRKWKVT